MVLQAGAAAAVLDAGPARATAALDAIEQVGRAAMDDLRRLVGEAAPLAGASPASLADLGPLLVHVRGAGLRVDLRVHGPFVELPAQVDASAYRIIQESLTNAIRHGQLARTAVTLRFEPEALGVEVLDRGPSDATGLAGGHGLAGMRERVALCGGRFDAGPRPDGGFAVRAQLPLHKEPA